MASKILSNFTSTRWRVSECTGSYGLKIFAESSICARKFSSDSGADLGYLHTQQMFVSNLGRSARKHCRQGKMQTQFSIANMKNITLLRFMLTEIRFQSKYYYNEHTIKIKLHKYLWCLKILLHITLCHWARTKPYTKTQ